MNVEVLFKRMERRPRDSLQVNGLLKTNVACLYVTGRWNPISRRSFKPSSAVIVAAILARAMLVIRALLTAMHRLRV